ncbi:MAG: hypothetical protein JJU05_02790 [Verrucomicrobia bacterium]|nr:hypothetical protein [Verrucomicrobiota bacterium]MCH8527671.1 hypothetical protein [Kiritimatiellia bacterium]
MTILSVSLLLVVVLALVATVRMELRTVTEHQELLQARANARLGGHLALAELQRTLGPDTRVSARAEILTPANPDGHGGGIGPFTAHESTRFWTGVWDSEQQWLGTGLPENAGPLDPKPYRPYKGDRGNRFRSWLVSLPQAERDNILTVRDPVPVSDAQTVALARVRAEPPGGGAAVLSEVRAPLIEMNNNAATAWWVSDEGVKANVRLTDPFRGQSVPGAEDTSRMLFPHRENFAATSWFEEIDFDDEDQVDRLQKLGAGTNNPWLAFSDAPLSSEAVTAMNGSPGSTQGDSLLSDFTVHSAGVLSNNKKGGLRKDLSLAFWRDPAEIADPTGGLANAGFNRDFSNRTASLHGRIFNWEDFPGTVAPAGTTQRFFGPQWDILRDFHNSYQKFDSSAATPTVFFDPLRSIRTGNTLYARYQDSLGLFGGPGSSNNWLHEGGRQTEIGGILTADDGRRRGQLNSSPVTPVLLGAYLTFEVDTTYRFATDTYRPRFRISAVFNLWNPYNVSINPRRLGDGNTGAWILNTYTGNFRFILQKNGSDVGEFTIRDLIGASTDSRINFVIHNHGSNLHFMPGEIRQYRLISGRDLSPNSPEGSLIFNASDMNVSSDDQEFNGDDVVGILLDTSAAENRFRPGGGTEGGVRFDLHSQLHRYNFFFEETPDTTYEAFERASRLRFPNNDPLFVFAIDLSVKSSEGEGQDVAGMFSNFNPAALFPGGALPEIYPGFQAPNIFARVTRDPVMMEVDSSNPSRFRGLWGETREQGGSPFVTLFDVPMRPPESLGQYQHAQMSYFATQPAHAFGNSMAHPHVDRAFAHDVVASTKDGAESENSQIDLSWFLNDALWDDYFLSTVRPDATGFAISPERDRFIEIDPTRTYNISNADDYRTLAGNLLLQGAFNVNSTSVEAWTAFLSALGGPSEAGDLEFPFHRLSRPTGSPNSAWTGAPRDLSRAQIRRLAEEMVEQVRARGPFLSLSDFVNRRLENGDRGAMGTVQAAISAANLNNIVPSTPSILAEAPRQNNIIGKVATLAPGDISQADVLTTLAPKMSARSDTFVIRSYGRTENSTTEAWCEFLVQRYPDPHDHENFGRSFRILHFRYLNEDEI